MQGESPASVRSSSGGILAATKSFAVYEPAASVHKTWIWRLLCHPKEQAVSLFLSGPGPK